MHNVANTQLNTSEKNRKQFMVGGIFLLLGFVALAFATTRPEGVFALSALEGKLKTASDQLLTFLQGFGSAILGALIAWQLINGITNADDPATVKNVKKAITTMVILIVLLWTVPLLVEFILGLAK